MFQKFQNGHWTVQNFEVAVKIADNRFKILYRSVITYPDWKVQKAGKPGKPFYFTLFHLLVN